MGKLWNHVTRKGVFYLAAGYLANFDRRESCCNKRSVKHIFVVNCITRMSMNVMSCAKNNERTEADFADAWVIETSTSYGGFGKTFLE